MLLMVGSIRMVSVCRWGDIVGIVCGTTCQKHCKGRAIKVEALQFVLWMILLCSHKQTSCWMMWYYFICITPSWQIFISNGICCIMSQVLYYVTFPEEKLNYCTRKELEKPVILNSRTVMLLDLQLKDRLGCETISKSLETEKVQNGRQHSGPMWRRLEGPPRNEKEVTT